MKAIETAIATVQITVEERRIEFGLNPDTWRTHVFSGLTAIPEQLPPSFAPEDAENVIPLRALLEEACANRRQHTVFETPYTSPEAGQKRGPTVLRTVEMKIGFKPKHGAAAAESCGGT